MADESSLPIEGSEVRTNPAIGSSGTIPNPQLGIPENVLLESIEVPEDAVPPAPDALPDAVIMENPSATPHSSITRDALDKICNQHQLPLDLVLLPGPTDRPHNPPEGYTVCNRYMFWSGVIPPFKEFIRYIL